MKKFKMYGKRLLSLILLALMILSTFVTSGFAASNKRLEIKEGVYMIQSALDPNKVVDIYGGSTSAGANAAIYTVHEGLNQLFYIKKNGNYYLIIALNSGQGLDVFGASSDSKTNICQWYTDPNDIAEQWEIFDAGNGYVYIRSALGTYMDVQNASTKDGTNVWAYKFNGSTAQRFRLVAIDTEVYDLDIQSLDTIFITPGSSSSFEFTFKGSGISKISVSTSSRTGLSSKLNTQWNRYPNRCHTTVTLSASDGFESGTLTVKLLHKNGGILYSKEIKVLPLPASVSAVKDMQDTLTQNTCEYKNILNDCLTVSTEILASKEVLRSLGLTAGSISSGFVTAGWSVLTDTDLLSSIAQLEVARFAVNKAIASANTVLSYENISNKRSAIEFMQAYRDCAAWFHASTQLLQPILDEYAQHADKSTTEQISILSQYFIEGSFDGLLSGLDNIDRTADLLMKYRDQAGNINSFVETALPLFPAYTNYQSAYAMWNHTIQQINNL